MSPSRKVALCSIVTLIVISLGVLAFSPLYLTRAQRGGSSAQLASTQPHLPQSTLAQGPYTVQGNAILGANNQHYFFHGIGRDGLEYNCSGEGPLDSQHLAYMGSGTNTGTETYWGANTVRLPLSEGFWLNGAPGYPCTAAQYQALVKQTVDNLTALKLNVIIDLQWSDAGGQSLQGGGPWAMADGDSVTFWQQVASIYKGYNNVLFELFNEPHPSQWSCWSGPCNMTNDTSYSDDCHCTKAFTYQGVGMQALVNAVRNAGASNVVIVAGMNWGYDLSKIGTYTITGPNVVYDSHPYPYSDKQPNTWDGAFGNISATYPVISAESGEYDCGTSYMSPLLNYFDSHQIGWIGWAWAVPTPGAVCGYPQLTTDYLGTPSATMGQLIYQHLHSYTPTYPPGPVRKTWYFAEGRVGAGFKEYLTLGNPDLVNDCSVNIQYLIEGGSAVTKTVTVSHASRLTESVNGDLNVPPTQSTGVSVSAVITVNAGSNCNGIVAERPMYFNYHGINSGSDVVGATQLGTTFYFGDVPTGGGYSSFITILNPSGNSAATVTATYYLGGHTVGTAQTVTVQPGVRGTIAPNGIGLPAHVAAIVTSSQPVMVERPDYFSNINAGNAKIVSGAASVLGVQTLANDWLFAEGYTAGQFQEYLVISNIDTVANAVANVTINLEYSNGATQSFGLAVNSLDQTIWNVNANATAGAVSAEITSTGANIVVERKLFFHYDHTVNVSGGFNVTAMGGTDVIGQIGPAGKTSYSFAEGYNKTGYNEWLTLQNPTGSNETIYVTLVNGYGRVYTPSGYLVPAHSRYTVDITALVLQTMVQPNDDHRGYEVSMTVQTIAPGAFFVAERPMYWNTGSGGTQGGSDVIGYVGG